MLIVYLYKLKDSNKISFNFPLKKQVYLFILLIGISSILGQNTFKSFFSFVIDFLEIFLLFFVVWRGFQTNVEAYSMLKKLSYLFVLISIYGIYTYYSDSNQYIDFVMQYGNNEEITTKLVVNTDRGLTKQVNSIFYHSVEFAAIISIFIPVIILIFSENLKFNSIKSLYLFAPLFAAILTGSRSLIVSTTIFILLIFYSTKTKVKYRFIIIFTTISFILFSSFPTIINLTFNFNDSNSNSIQGSSVGMRVSQLDAALNVFDKNILYGHGYKYNAEIMGQYAFRDLNGFESLFFQVLINHGLLGIIAYLILFGGLFNFYFKNKAYVFLAGLISYFFFIMLTGPMNSFSLFIIINTLFIRNLVKDYDGYKLKTSTYE